MTPTPPPTDPQDPGRSGKGPLPEGNGSTTPAGTSAPGSRGRRHDRRQGRGPSPVVVGVVLGLLVLLLALAGFFGVRAALADGHDGDRTASLPVQGLLEEGRTTGSPI